MDKSGKAKVFRAIGDPTRLEIIQLLKNKGPMIVEDISANFKTMGRAAISYHLKILKDANIISHQGRMKRYQFTDQWLVGLLDEFEK